MSTVSRLLPSLLLLALTAPAFAQVPAPTPAPGAAAAPEGRDPAAPASVAPAPAAPAAAPGAPRAGAPTDAQIIAAQKPSYPLKTCLVSDEPMGGAMGPPAGYVHEGRYMEFCCIECKFNVAEDPAKFLAKLDAAVVAAQKPTYPLTTCVVGGEALDDKALDVVWGTRLVRLCCGDCRQEFAADPAPVLAKLDAALIRAQSATYALDTCVVSGEQLEEPVEVLHGVQLVKFCCRQCFDEFTLDPGKYLATLDAAQAARAARPAAPADKPAR